MIFVICDLLESSLQVLVVRICIDARFHLYLNNDMTFIGIYDATIFYSTYQATGKGWEIPEAVFF
jgi:hypothetical protein